MDREKKYLSATLISFPWWLLLALFLWPQANPRTRIGNEIFKEHFPQELRVQRLGLVINHTSVLPDGTPLYQALIQDGIKVAAIFTPEHGFTGTIEGGEGIDNSLLGDIQIFSLYGSTQRPTSEQMTAIDAFVYDIQDVGTRFYTYITTLMYVLEAASQTGLPVFVLDRPNPTGGVHVEGPLLYPKFESFIGACSIAVRYGLTCGELALMMKGEGWVPQNVDVRVVKMENWQRHYLWHDTQLKWVPTSPNMPSPEAALVYPGTGLLGGIILNQGLGTNNPFLQFGAPWLDPEKILIKLPQEAYSGISMEKISYTPRAMPGKTMNPPYKDKLCHGLRLTIHNGKDFQSVHFTLELIRILKELYPDKIYLESQSLPLMFGNDWLTQYLEGKLDYEDLMKQVRRDEEQFKKKRSQYLLY